MIRVVAQHSPALFAILGVFPESETTLAPTIKIDGQTYYRTETHHHYVLYKAALSGWGAAGRPNDPRPAFDPAQR